MDKPATIEELGTNITRIIGEIPLEMLGRVIADWNFRVDHLNEIIFKK